MTDMMCGGCGGFRALNQVEMIAGSSAWIVMLLVLMLSLQAPSSTAQEEGSGRGD